MIAELESHPLRQFLAFARLVGSPLPGAREEAKRIAQLVPAAATTPLSGIDSAAHLTIWDNSTQAVKAVRDLLCAADARR